MPDFVHVAAQWVRDHKDEIDAAAAIAVAAFTGLLLYVAWRQKRETRILQRAYIAVEPGGIVLWSSGSKSAA